MKFNSGNKMTRGPNNRSGSCKKNNSRSREVRAQKNLNTNIYNPVFHREDFLLDELDKTNIYKSHGTIPDHVIRRTNFTELTIGSKSPSFAKPKSMKAWKRNQNKLNIEWRFAWIIIRDEYETAFWARAAEREEENHNLCRNKRKIYYQSVMEPFCAKKARNDRRVVEQHAAERTAVLPSLSRKNRKEINKWNSGVEKILDAYESGRSLYIRNEDDTPTYEFPSEWRYRQRYQEINKYYESMETVLDAFESGASFLIPNAHQVPASDEEVVYQTWLITPTDWDQDTDHVPLGSETVFEGSDVPSSQSVYSPDQDEERRIYEGSDSWWLYI
jgi:hypothetical protein